MLARLDNEVVFRKAFTDPSVLAEFVRDVAGMDFQPGTIETGKRFNPVVGQVDIEYDIFAESKDHRVVVEIQRVDYDHNFNRFLHYHMMAVAQMIARGSNYAVERVVYTIIVLTAPYRTRPNGMMVRDPVLISSVDPRNLQGEVREVYGHKLIFLNPRHSAPELETRYREWMDLFLASLSQNQTLEGINMNRPVMQKVVDLISIDHLTPAENAQMKIAEGRQIVARQLTEDLEEERRQKEEALNQKEEERRQKQEALQRESEALREIERLRAQLRSRDP